MLLFLGGLALLVIGYFTYGKFVEKVIGPDDRATPALRRADGVDFMILPLWKAMLIQLLNIAGIGPVIGVILGIKYGTAAFLIIPVGNILGGAVHDFVSAMMSMRANGANLPELIRRTCGETFYHIFSVFMCLLLLLVVAVFINVPANLLDHGFFPQYNIFWISVAVIFVYYIIATLFSIDKIIGRFYPIFGALLLLGSFAIFIKLLIDAGHNPALLLESNGFKANMFTAAKQQPILPMLFVTIACGILSGFHATQSPIIARTLKSERDARRCFYGMMVLEGVIAMIWAGAALAIYNISPELMFENPNLVLTKITSSFLGSWGGGITIASVVILAVTSGDTAMRSLRLSFAEIFKIPRQVQRKLSVRITICLPLIAITLVLLYWSNLSAKSFSVIWNYFAWGNQVLAAATLMAATIWLVSLKKNAVITLLPGMFMIFIVTTYILWIAPDRGNSAYGFGIQLSHAYILGIAAAVAAAAAAIHSGLQKRMLSNQNWLSRHTTMEFHNTIPWAKIGRFFFFEHFFSTLWTIIGLLILIAGLCLLPRAIRLAKSIRKETRQALVESHSALRETRKAIRDGYRVAKIIDGHLQEARELNQYVRQPFQVNIQLQGKSDWFDMNTVGSAVIVPQSKVPAAVPAEAAKPSEAAPEAKTTSD